VSERKIQKRISMTAAEWERVEADRAARAARAGTAVSTSAALRALVLRGLAAGGTP
jgi:hypothetical protein